MTSPITIKQEKSDDGSTDSSRSPSPKPSKKHVTRKKREKKKTSKDIYFNDCFRFEATCPFKSCPDHSKTIFTSQQSYQQHHALKHERRDRFRNNLVWKCPQCQKICSSFYNFSAHVSMHRNVCKPPWICTLPAAKHMKDYNDNTEEGICGKRSSTKNNLISHIRSVHNFNVIGYKERSRTEHCTHANKKRKRAISVPKAVQQPKCKRPRMDGNHSTGNRVPPPSLYPFLLQMYGEGMNGTNVSQNGNVLPIVDNNKSLNLFPGFNHATNTTNNAPSNTNVYDNITVKPHAIPSVRTPHNTTTSSRPSAALPTMEQLSNLCQLLQTLQQAEGNQNASNGGNNTDMNTVMNCISYIKKCQRHQAQQPHSHCHHHHHHRMQQQQRMPQNRMHCPTHVQNMTPRQMQMMMMRRKQGNQMNIRRNAHANNHSNMNHMNANCAARSTHPNVNNEENNVTLSICNMIKTLNHMEHVSNMNGLGMSNMHKMNGMNMMRNMGNMNRINNITIHNNINNISNDTNNNTNQAFHSNLPPLNNPF